MQLLLGVGVPEMVRADRVLTERGDWADMFFYPATAVLRTAHTTHVKTFIRPQNVLLHKLHSINSAFDIQSYCQKHLHPITTMEGGKVLVFDIARVRTEFADYPNLAFHFYRWLAYRLSKRKDQIISYQDKTSEVAPDDDELLLIGAQTVSVRVVCGVCRLRAAVSLAWAGDER